MLAIKGIGKDTIAGFFAEVGDLSYYSHPKTNHQISWIKPKREYIG